MCVTTREQSVGNRGRRMRQIVRLKQLLEREQKGGKVRDGRREGGNVVGEEASTC